MRALRYPLSHGGRHYECRSNRNTGFWILAPSRTPLSFLKATLLVADNIYKRSLSLVTKSMDHAMQAWRTIVLILLFARSRCPRRQTYKGYRCSWPKKRHGDGRCLMKPPWPSKDMHRRRIIGVLGIAVWKECELALRMVPCRGEKSVGWRRSGKGLKS